MFNICFSCFHFGGWSYHAFHQGLFLPGGGQLSKPPHYWFSLLPSYCLYCHFSHEIIFPNKLLANKTLSVSAFWATQAMTESMISKTGEPKIVRVGSKTSLSILLDLIMTEIGPATTSLNSQTHESWLWGKEHHIWVPGSRYIPYSIGLHTNLSG